MVTWIEFLCYLVSLPNIRSLALLFAENTSRCNIKFRMINIENSMRNSNILVSINSITRNSGYMLKKQIR
jgi:hypothetical protein